MKFHTFMFTNAQRVCHMYHNHSVSCANYLESDPFFRLLCTHWCPLPVKLFEAVQWEAQKEFWWLCQDYYLLTLLILSTSECYIWVGVRSGIFFFLLLFHIQMPVCCQQRLLVSRSGFCLKFPFPLSLRNKSTTLCWETNITSDTLLPSVSPILSHFPLFWQSVSPILINSCKQINSDHPLY